MRKRMLSYILGGILALTGVDIPFLITNARSEEIRDLIKNSNNIIPADYPNIFNISYEEYGFNNTTYINLCEYFFADVNGKKTIFPCYIDIYSYYIDSSTFESSIMNLSQEKSEKRLSRIKKALSLVESLEEEEFLFCIEYYDIITNKSIGALIDNKFYNNDDFFVNKEIVSRIDEMNHEELMNYFSINYNELDLPKELIERLNQNKRISVAEYYEFYLKAIPKEYWPIITESKININTTLPNFKDEILDQDIKDDFGFAIVLYKNGYEKSILLKFVKEGYTLYDYFTGELVTYGGKHINEIYVKNYNLSKKGMEDLAMVASPVEFLEPKLIYDFPELFDEYKKVKTYRDMVTWYQKIPLEKQIDYSFYDFSNSPNPDIDPAWLANRPTPAPTPVPTPTPTPPPYVELTIGSSGQEVLDLKQRCLELGYFRTTSFNDRFTDSTADTVRLFEKNNGLPVDGVADAVMLGVLFSDSAVGK